MIDLTPNLLAAMPLPRLDAAGDKETRGRVLALAGSLQVPGAALVTGLAALRAGAGKLQLAVPSAIATVIGVAVPEARVIGLAQPPPGSEALDAATRSDAVVVGPGWMDEAEARAIVHALAAAGGPAALVIDAGALTCLKDLGLLRAFAGRAVLTPHAGEMAGMLGKDKDAIEVDPLAAGREAAQATGCVVVMKGAESFIVQPDGTAWRHTGGTVGLATSGSGDVLAGVVGGLLARGCDPAQAAAWGVAAHGAAGSRLGRTVGEVGFLARELLAQIPWALSAPDLGPDNAVGAARPSPGPGLTGGCLCGAVRYRLASSPFDAGYCHCRMCQKFSGSPVMAFATVPLTDFVLTEGEPVRRPSSSFGERWFCGACGSPLGMRVDDEPDTIDFTIASLDEPDRAAPGFHIWRESRIPWFDTRDDLPRHARKRGG